MKNYYQILGVDTTATVRDIKKAYVPLALRSHPDLAPEGTREDARRRYRDIQVAYWILSDPRLRARFDRKAGLASKGKSPDVADQTMAALHVSPSERVELDREFGRAEVAYSRGEYWEAAGILSKLIERHPGEATWQRLFAQATARCGAFDRARKACEVALVLDPESVESFYIYGEVLAESGDYSGAARQCRHALNLDEDYGPAKKLLEKATTLRVVLLRQRASVPLYVVAVVGLAVLVAILLWRHTS